MTSLQALLRLASLRWLGVFVCALATLLSVAGTASALEAAQTKTRVWGFESAADNSFGLFRAASFGKHQGNCSARAEAASGSLLAAEGAATIDTAAVRFTQNSVKGTFGNGTTLNDAIAALREGGAEAGAKYPAIRIFERDGALFTLDNRRLLVFSQAGQQVPFRFATAAEVAAETTGPFSKFTTTASQGWGQFITIRGGP